METSRRVEKRDERRPDQDLKRDQLLPIFATISKFELVEKTFDD